MKHFSIVFLVLMLATFARQAFAQNATKALSDVDYSHLKSEPKFSWGSDPFMRRPGYSISEDDGMRPDKLKLEALIYHPKDSMAIVSGTTVEIGDEVGGFIVDEIGPSYVVIRKGNSIFELTMSASPLSAAGPKPPEEKAKTSAEIMKELLK